MLEFEERPWGRFDVLSDEDNHKVKRITVKPGKRLSLQRHQKRQEHWYMVSGIGTVTLDDVEHTVPTGHAIDIPLGAKHRIANESASDDLVFIEVQTGSYFGEDDIERFADDYGRA